MARVQRGRSRTQRPQAGLELDQALIALFIGAMNANNHVAPDEAARAHNLILSMRRFRRKSGDSVGKLIQEMRALLEESDGDAVMDAAVSAIPARMRLATFAVLTDVLLADGRMDAQERRFLKRIGSKLEIDPATSRQVVEVVLLKNQL